MAITALINGAVMVASSPRTVAKMWAQGLIGADRAAAARQFYALPADFRMALLNVQTGQEKSTMIRSLITNYMAVKEDLTPEQQAVLQEAYDLVTPEFCATRLHAPTDLSRRILAALPKEDGWLFVAPGGGVVGPQEKDPSTSILPVTVQAELFMASKFVPSAYQGWCDCEPGVTQICLRPPDSQCRDEQCGIDGWWDGGCGFMHLFNCTGQCSNGGILTQP